MIDPTEIEKVKELGESIGYGHLMTLASSLWKENLRRKGYPTTGAFVPALPKNKDTDLTNTMYDKCVSEYLNNK